MIFDGGRDKHGLVRVFPNFDALNGANGDAVERHETSASQTASLVERNLELPTRGKEWLKLTKENQQPRATGESADPRKPPGF